MEPLILLIEPELDERAATATMSRAQKVYEEGARDISRVMRSQLTEGTRAAGKGFEELETKARRAYLGMQDAGEKVAAAERKAAAARDRGASNAEVLARRVERARLDEIQAIERASAAYNDYDRATQSAAGSAARLGTSIRGSLRTAVGDGVRNATSQFGALGDAASDALLGMSGRGAAAALGVAGVGAAAAVAGKQLYDLGSTWDSVADGIAIRTGKVGAELDAVVGSVRTVASDTAAPLENIGDIAGRVSASLGLAGQDLDNMTRSVANLNRMTGENTDIRGLSKTFRIFDIEGGDDQLAALNSLVNTSQAVQVPVNDLIATMNNAGKATSEFGLNFGETAGLLTSFEDAGADMSKIMPGLSIALKNFAASGREPGDALQETIVKIKELSDAGNAQATTLAQQTFGKGYIDFLNVIKDGDLDVDALTKSLDAQGQTIEDLSDATSDWSEEWQILKNNLSSALAPAAEATFGFINQELTRAADSVSTFAGWISSAGDAWIDFANMVQGNPINVDVAVSGNPNARPPVAASGAPSVQGGTGPGGLGDLLGNGGMTPPPPAAPVPLPSTALQAAEAPNFYRDWYPNDQNKKDTLPPAPEVPLQYTNTAGMPTQVADAVTRLDEARHDIAEKQARLNQLQQLNVNDENVILKARNDLAKSGQDELQAERALYDARVNIAQQQDKQLRSMTSDLEDAGNKLDSDFGISKGLGGIVENITRFLGNLIAAPFVQALGLVAKANPNEGSGMVGVLAANGAFGSQYTAASIAASQPQPGGGQAAYPGYGAQAALPYGPPPAAAPGVDARTFAHQTMMPFFENQGFTVGDHGADKYGEHQNGALDIMVDSIAEGNNVLKQVLADPNVYGAIFNNKAYGYGQGSEPRNYSGGNTGNPTQDHQNHVHAWYKPGGGNNIAPSSGGGARFALPSSGMPSPSVASAPTFGAVPAPPAMIPGFPTSAPGGGMYPGVGMPQSPMFGGGMPGIGSGIGQAGAAGIPQPAAGASIGAGQGGTAFPSAGGNSGNVIGGIPLDAAMAATAALDTMAPGSSAAAKIGIQLANRTVGFGAQVGGIAGSGVLETLSLGDNPKGNLGASWLGRGIGGLAGAAPALPNIAGGEPPGPMTEQGGGQGGEAGTTINQNDQSIHVKNEKATEDQTGKIIAEHQAATWAPAGKQP